MATLSDEGEIRITFTDASEANKRFVMEASTERLRCRAAVSSVQADARKYLVLPKSAAALEEDDKILVEFKPVTATEVDLGLSVVEIPITIRNKRTGTIHERTLRHADLATGDVTDIAANKWTIIGTYTISAQEQVKLGWNIAQNSRILIHLEERS